MDTYLVTAEQVALFFSDGERIEPRRAVEESLRNSGQKAWPALEAELFCGRRGTLLLARPTPPRCAGERRHARKRPRCSQ